MHAVGVGHDTALSRGILLVSGSWSTVQLVPFQVSTLMAGGWITSPPSRSPGPTATHAFVEAQETPVRIPVANAPADGVDCGMFCGAQLVPFSHELRDVTATRTERHDRAAGSERAVDLAWMHDANHGFAHRDQMHVGCRE